MNIKHSLYLLPLAASVAFSTCALAQVAPLAPVDIRFEGLVTASVCTPQLSGPSVTGTTVTLDATTTAALSTQGATDKETPFTITVTCPTQLSGATQFWAHFNGASVNSNGRFVAQTGSSNVSFQLLDGPGGAVVLAGGAAAAGGPGLDQGTGSSAFSGTPPAVSASKEYAVRYYAENGLTNADAGVVAADGTYTVHFY